MSAEPQPGSESPRTQFAVEVLANIKGDANGTVVVNQLSGYDHHGDLILAEGVPLLERGSRYLFAGTLNRDDGWYTIVPKYGHVRVDADEQYRKAVARMATAFKRQVLNPERAAELGRSMERP